jgi:class 3 adenylate cyclase/predicted ATPase
MTPVRSYHAIMDLGNWLRSLGLQEFEAVFRENAIDETVLDDLTEDHLRELGFPLGVRLKLLKAIAEISASAGTKTPPIQVSPATPPVDSAERRQVTVVFSDLVDSTALSARMDPEDLSGVLAEYRNCVVDTVQRFGGFVAQYLGDGVLMYFGYPLSHEDDAERAVGAALKLTEAVVGLKVGTTLQARVGIATGLVVVGDLVGSKQMHAIVGKTPNLAARLQAIAEPNTVVICDSTRRLLGSLFELEDLGSRDLKGIAQAARVWRVQRVSSVASRFEALHGTGLTALVGRDEETELLLRRWSTAQSGEGQVVLLSGEPGIGKSRLTAALQERLHEEPHVRLHYFCSPQHPNSPLHPIISRLERVAGLAPADFLQIKLDKLDAMLARTSTSIEDAALFAEMLSLENDGRYPVLALTGEQRRQRVLDALTLQLQAFTRGGPVLMVFEDAHWSDPTSLEALSRAVDQIATLRVLLIVTFRPEFDAPWIGRPHVSTLTLNRLTQHEVGTMIDNLVGNKVLPSALRQDIVERTDGIPLFVEEMTKALLEAGSDADSEKVIAAVPPEVHAIPASLHASLMSRLDRLGPAKEVAQIGAALGRGFSYSLLAAVVRQPEAELESSLDRLVAAGLLFRQGETSGATYLFKHALVQDVAYSTLLRNPRLALHGRIAESLESRFPEIGEREPELLARHCTEAGLIEKAAALWGKAGRRSLERSALVEAAEHLTRALAQICALPITPALRREQIQLQVAIITPLMHVKGYAAPETKAAAERARLLIEQAEALGEPPEDPLLLFSVLYSFWTASFVAFNGDAVRELANQFLALAEKRRATAPLMIGHRMMGSVLHRGDFVEGQAHLDRAIALYNPSEHRSLAARFGQDVRVAALSYRSWALWMLGYPDAALVDASRAIEEAREIGQAATLMYALVHACVIYIECGNYSAANEGLNELVSLAEEKGAQFWKALGLSVRGCLLVSTGRPADAIHVITSSITALQSTGSTVWLPLHLSYLARAYVELGQFDDARRCIAEAIAGIETSKEKWHEAEIYRIAGEIALLSPQPDAAKAETYFHQALAIARAQGSRSWELRATMSLARLWGDQGRRRDGCDSLASVLGWFTEGFDTFDFRQAKVLLDVLGPEGDGSTEAENPRIASTAGRRVSPQHARDP